MGLWCAYSAFTWALYNTLHLLFPVIFAALSITCTSTSERLGVRRPSPLHHDRPYEYSNLVRLVWDRCLRNLSAGGGNLLNNLLLCPRTNLGKHLRMRFLRFSTNIKYAWDKLCWFPTSFLPGVLDGQNYDGFTYRPSVLISNYDFDAQATVKVCLNE